MNILIVCGGTGGHLFPGIAVGEELLARRHQVLLVVSEKEVDRRIVEQTPGFLVQTLPAIGWRGARPDRLVRFGVAMLAAQSRSRQIFRNFQPNAVLGMGGFSSVAPVFCAWRRGVPACIHESNAIPGRANRLMVRFAARVAVGVPNPANGFPRGKTVWTGTPVRACLRNRKDPAEARAALGLAADRPTVLVMGGSQGARGLNRLVTETAARITSTQVQWLHLTGTEDEAAVRAAYAGQPARACVSAFSMDMDRLYGAADLIIARAGASSLAEIAVQGLPGILVPYPFAADNHQRANAEIFARSGAAVVCEEDGWDHGRMADEIVDILTNRPRRQDMIEATKRLRHADAHVKLADMLEQLIGKGACTS